MSCIFRSMALSLCYLMLLYFYRELESKLAVERSAREKAETQLEDAKQAAQRPSTVAVSRPLEQYEKKITDLQNELEQVC